jgi:hypothetical protein
MGICLSFVFGPRRLAVNIHLYLFKLLCADGGAAHDGRDWVASLPATSELTKSTLAISACRAPRDELPPASVSLQASFWIAYRGRSWVGTLAWGSWPGEAAGSGSMAAFHEGWGHRGFGYVQRCYFHPYRCERHL